MILSITLHRENRRMDVPEEHKDRIFDSELQADNMRFKASDDAGSTCNSRMMLEADT